MDCCEGNVHGLQTQVGGVYAGIGAEVVCDGDLEVKFETNQCAE